MNFPKPTTFLDPEVERIIKSSKIDDSYEFLVAAKTDAEYFADFWQFMKNYPRYISGLDSPTLIKLREKIQCKLDEANIGKIRVTWDNEWLSRVELMSEADQEIEITKRVEYVVRIYNDISISTIPKEKTPQVLIPKIKSVGIESFADLCDLDRSKVVKTNLAPINQPETERTKWQ